MMCDMPIIQFLQKLTAFKLWLLTIVISVAMSGVIVVGMGFLLKGTVPGDYLLTGFVTSMVVSAIIVAILTLLLSQLKRDAESRQALIDRLGKSEERAKDAMQASHSALWELDVITGRVHLSEAWSQFLGDGREQTDTTLRALAERVPVEEREMVRAAIVGAVKGTESSNYKVEHRVRKKDGSYIWVASEGQVIERDGSGRALRMIGINRDITERREAETEFRTIVQATGDGFFMFTVPDGRILEVNPAYCAMSGYSLEELLSMSVFDIVEMYGREQIENNIEMIRSGKPMRIDSRHRRRDGSVFDVEVSSRYMDVRGGVIVTFIRDISDRKQAEREVRIAAAAFESQDGMLITDANATIQRVNNAFTEITGYSAEEVVGRNPNLLTSGRHDKAFYAAMWKSLIKTGSWTGEIWNRRKNGELYPEHLTITSVKDRDGGVINYVASLADITMRKKSEAEIQRLAYYDHLTNLPNRRLLMERLHQALVASGRRKWGGALLFIDLDNFKNLNDTQGHDVGDLLLQQVAARLTSCIREGDSVARLGGDEFVVMLLELSSHPIVASEQAKTVGEKIIAVLSETYRLAEHEYVCTASIGITLFQGREQEAEALLRQADIAMYQSKHAGRNALRFFDQKMQESLNVRASLEAELRKALERGQLKPYYQVQVNAKGKPEGVEVLLRWLHPELGPVPPVQFIPLAEETGMIIQIGAWVLDAACAQIKLWQGREPFRNLVVAVNISAEQFYQQDFVEQVQFVIRKHNINPMLLKLELTESLAVQDIESAIRKMHVLKEIGVSFSLDDFGTGFSSLSYLKRLPLDQIKIDQSFVRNITNDNADKVMVMAITGLGMNFELNIIAEGVETEAQFKLLHRFGCENFQGYLFSKPLPVEQFEEWVLKRRAEVGIGDRTGKQRTG
jgi:diguanylate cyclase (GGDEF)-like protein/PAS domain S-box-containing protein